MSCKVKVIGKPPADYLHFQIFYRRMRFWQKTGLKNIPENRQRVEDAARVISQEISDGNFSYVKWFPKGNKAHLFRRDPDDDHSSLSPFTVESYYKSWIPKQHKRVRPHRVKDFKSQFKCHLLPARIGRRFFGKISLSLLRVTDLQELQVHLKAKGLKANSVNSIIGGSLRAMVKAARADGIVKADLYDKAMFSPLPLTDTRSSIDPYSPEERDAILEAFRTRRPHYYAFVFFRFWTGARPSETCALRWGDVDLRYSTARFNKGRVQGHEDGTKNARSNREIHLHRHLVEVLKNHKPLHVKPETYVFTTPAATPIDEDNFYHREWLPALRAKDVRPRPFYNTRHTYASFLVSIGAKSGFISAQTGDSIKTIELFEVRARCRHHARARGGAGLGNYKVATK